MSPYLFLLCAEGLSGLLNKAKEEKMIKGVSVARNGPQVTHLFFANDSLLFCQAKRAECLEILRILQLYERSSGQKVNMEKSGIFFSSNTSEEDRVMICNTLSIHNEMMNEQYLGMPLLTGKNKSKELRSIKERMQARVNSWNGRMISQAGKAILIQSVGQSIPIYMMSCLLFPKGFIQEINMILAGFWWGDTRRGRKIHWKNWDSLCQSWMED